MEPCCWRSSYFYAFWQKTARQLDYLTTLSAQGQVGSCAVCPLDLWHSSHGSAHLRHSAPVTGWAFSSPQCTLSCSHDSNTCNFPSLVDVAGSAQFSHNSNLIIFMTNSEQTIYWTLSSPSNPESFITFITRLHHLLFCQLINQMVLSNTAQLCFSWRGACSHFFELCVKNSATSK